MGLYMLYGTSERFIAALFFAIKFDGYENYYSSIFDIGNSIICRYRNLDQLYLPRKTSIS
jgi:hypothetical protein